MPFVPKPRNGEKKYMPHTLERVSDTQIKLTITVPAEQVERAMRHAAEHLSEEVQIPGFRPGKATYEVLKERFGEMKLLESASEELIRTTFVAAMLEEDLETVGQPYFNVEKMAPGNDMVYTAEIALMPHATKLADYKNLTVAPKSVEATPEVIAQAKKDLLRMRTKEVRADKDHALAKGDKAVINMTMKKDGVVLEGGEAQNHGVYTAESYYIEGFIEQILGAKEGEERNFTLPFPKEHYQKHVAGQNVDFTVAIKEIFILETPAFDDEFATGLGFKNVADLEAQLVKNITEEQEEKESRRQEKELLELLANKSTFSEISDLLVNTEIEKMINEMRQWVTENGMEFNDYLKSINKTIPQIKLDLAPQAMTRLKVAIILTEIAKLENIAPTSDELDAEVDKIAAQVDKDPQAKEYVYSPQYRERLEVQLKNKKTVELLKGIMVK